MRLIIHPGARKDLISAARYYDARRTGLGDRFLAECADAIERIVETPTRFRRTGGTVRRFLLTGFPYSVLYQHDGDRVHIVTFSHHSRRPDHWRDRLAD